MRLESGLLVDCADYFRAIYQSACEAERFILLSGWDFDSSVALLRGPEAENAAYPVTLLALLSELCAQKPALRVYVLAWDYSMVFVLEREWMQRLRFDWTTPPSFKFRFDGVHPPGASHHQKTAVFDGKLAFVGGIDLTTSRWDDRAHAVENPLRDARRTPYHDAAGFCTGRPAQTVLEIFRERWRRACGDELELPAIAGSSAHEFRGALPLSRGRIELHSTRAPVFESDQPCFEISAFYAREIARAEHSIYLETQYFTSREIHDALVLRMRDRRRAPLNLVAVLPKTAGSAKERLTLGDVQEEILASLCQIAQTTESELRVVYSADCDAAGDEVSTFIHSKIAIFDDRVLSVGSANLTNRSMSLDTELDMSFEVEHPGDTMARDIAGVRASLLAEHAGVSSWEAAAQPWELAARTDSLCALGKKLRHRELVPPESDHERVIRLERVFDPDRPLTDVELSDVLG
jgi:phosphatidylserine/phosphatidylglycerophosphate/cardiolipin synthase-like enzyme